MVGNTTSCGGQARSPSLDNQDFKLDRCVAHIVHKAGYKAVSNRILIKKSWTARVRQAIDGNVAADRYKRAYFDSQQRLSATILAEQYRLQPRYTGSQPLVQADLTSSPLLRRRFWRQDNIRFDSALSEQGGVLHKRGRHAVRLSKWAQVANGVTELGAAPTGLLLKSSKIAFQPNIGENTTRSQLRVLLALGPIAALVSAISLAAGQKGVGQLSRLVASSIQADMRALIGSFSALSAFSSLISLGLSFFSAAVACKAPLSQKQVECIQKKKDAHLERLFVLIADVNNKPNAQALISKALKGKIPRSYRNEEGRPILIERLLNDVRSNPCQINAKREMAKTIGSYLTEKDFHGTGHRELLDLKLDKSELLERENHFVALTNLIEHARIEEKPSGDFKDLRHGIEGGVQNLRVLFLSRTAGLMDTLGFQKTSKKFRSLTEEAHQEHCKRLETHPMFASHRRFSLAKMLEHSHQYGPVTVALARASEALRVFNHSIVLSLNYQLTRPFAWLSGRIMENLIQEPNSRSVSFSVGRLISSTVWAVVDSFLILSLAGGNGVGLNGPESPVKYTFPLNIPIGLLVLPISVISTAAQMMLVAVPAAMLATSAKLACQIEGWQGNVARVADSYAGRKTMKAWT